jgi:predicted nucleic acid-binding protein
VIHLDTSFLVDLLRESRRGNGGPATALLAGLGDEELGLSIFVLCELHAGVEGVRRPDEERRRIEALVAPLALVLPDEKLPPIYGRALRRREREGATIATMDLLIGAAAVADGAPLVTRNRRHFERIEALDLIDY